MFDCLKGSAELGPDLGLPGVAGFATKGQLLPATRHRPDRYVL
jgi:hypothetical protein